jgi:hypothetical protein
MNEAIYPPSPRAEASAVPRIVGRSSSHFTRVVRMFAAEFAVTCEFERVPTLMSEDVDVYGGNPALRLPNLVTADGVMFGALGSCRFLHTLASTSVDVLWPEGVPLGLAANAQELTLQAMATEVTLIMSAGTGTDPSPYATKLRHALVQMLVWLNANLTGALETLPTRDVSYFEVALFCLLDHLEFRHITPLTPFAHLVDFRTRYALRVSARTTPFRFDV